MRVHAHKITQNHLDANVTLEINKFGQEYLDFEADNQNYRINFRGGNLCKPSCFPTNKKSKSYFKRNREAIIELIFEIDINKLKRWFWKNKT